VATGTHAPRLQGAFARQHERPPKRHDRDGNSNDLARIQHLRSPYFPQLKENNVGNGFLEDSQYRALVEGADLWFRTLVECGSTFGWRISELIGIKVGQVDLMQRVIRLAPGTTKNNEGREGFAAKSRYWSRRKHRQLIHPA